MTGFDCNQNDKVIFIVRRSHIWESLFCSCIFFETSLQQSKYHSAEAIEPSGIMSADTLLSLNVKPTNKKWVNMSCTAKLSSRYFQIAQLPNWRCFYACSRFELAIIRYAVGTTGKWRWPRFCAHQQWLSHLHIVSHRLQGCNWLRPCAHQHQHIIVVLPVPRRRSRRTLWPSWSLPWLSQGMHWLLDSVVWHIVAGAKMHV